MQVPRMSEEEAAKFIGISRSTLQKFRYKHQVEYLKLGRKILYEKPELERFIEGHRHPVVE